MILDVNYFEFNQMKFKSNNEIACLRTVSSAIVIAFLKLFKIPIAKRKINFTENCSQLD